MRIKRGWIRALALCGAVLGTQSCLSWGRDLAHEWSPLAKDSSDLGRAIAQALRETGQASAACAILRFSAPALIAAEGRTELGGMIPVGPRSLYHLGSISKSFTSLLAAILVEEGRLRYETTLGEVLAGYPLRDEYAKATVLDLINSRAGIIPFQLTERESPVSVEKLWLTIPAEYPGDPRAQRAAVAEFALSLPPIQGEDREPVPVYSNVGWAILGHVLELAGGGSYEELLEERILVPLGIRGYKLGGWPRDDYASREPVGHYPPSSPGAPPRIQGPSDGYRFPDWMNPAGGINLDIEGFALYATEHLAGLAGKGRLLGRSGYREIHRAGISADMGTMFQAGPSGQFQDLGHGWAIVPVEGGAISIAEGSGGTYFAFLAVYPELDLAFAGLCNSGSGLAIFERVIKSTTGFDLALE